LSPISSLIDVHAHLGDEAFDKDRDEVLKRALERGVRGVIAVGETLLEARRNLELADSYPDLVWPSAGLYPTNLSLKQADEITAFIRLHLGRLVAIGEVGLDHWMVKEDADKELQKEIFGRFIDLSLELDLPLNVHSRSAGRRAIEFLIEQGARRVLMHAFDGRASAAQQGVEAGFFFSVPPSIVRSKQKQKLVMHLPLENILLETDSPVLGPNPGERNEPANLMVSLEAVAEIKGEREEAIAEAVLENQRRLLGDL
jgi:TatD DNase family protein